MPGWRTRSPRHGSLELRVSLEADPPPDEARATVEIVHNGGVDQPFLVGHRDSVYSLAFNSAGTVLASASFDGSVMLWDPVTNRGLGALRGHVGFVRSVAFSPDGRFAVTGGDDQSVRTWDVESQRQIRVLDGHGDQVFSVAWSPDGDVLASASFDGTVRLFRGE